jgi:hypothetical protein
MERHALIFTKVNRQKSSTQLCNNKTIFIPITYAEFEFNAASYHFANKILICTLYASESNFKDRSVAKYKKQAFIISKTYEKISSKW